LNSAYHHRTHLKLVDITGMNCVNSSRVILVSTHIRQLKLTKYEHKHQVTEETYILICKYFAIHICLCDFKL